MGGMHLAGVRMGAKRRCLLRDLMISVDFLGET